MRMLFFAEKGNILVILWNLDDYRENNPISEPFPRI